MTYGFAHHPHSSSPLSSVASFRIASSDAGLFDRPDRAIAALRMLFLDVHMVSERKAERLAERLRADAGVRFWSEGDMREYAGLVNDLVGMTAGGLVGPDGVVSRLGVKVSRTGKSRFGRYALFYYQPRRVAAPHCWRSVPAGLTLLNGPG